MEKYRIDWACESIYKYSEHHDAYIYLCSFYTVGATRSNRKSTVIKKVENWYNRTGF